MNTLQRIESRLKQTSAPVKTKPQLPDRYFQVEDAEDGTNGVFGYPSGFCYATYLDLMKAQKEADRLTEQNRLTKKPTASGKNFALYYKLPLPSFSHVPGEVLEIVWKLGPEAAGTFVKALKAKKGSMPGFQEGDVATYRFNNWDKDAYTGVLFINEDNIVVALYEDD